MLTGYPLPTALGAPAASASPTPRRRDTTSAVRYPAGRRSRPALVLAMLLSASLHAALILGVGHRHKAPPRPVDDEPPMIAITMPQLKELDEPPPSNDAGDHSDIVAPVPMQADLPTIPHPSDFIQQIDLATLLPQPDFSGVKIYTVPEHIRRGAKPDGIANLFNLADLDRVPEPIMQPAPVFPAELKRVIERATVTVEFIVTTEGRVVNAVAVESTHAGFEEAAVTGVLKWRFRPGIKSGGKVNTRMRVPIMFRLVNGDF
jgi:protein TonB